MDRATAGQKRRLWIGSDHAGYEVKEKLKAFGVAKGIEWTDLGATSPDSVNYPTFAHFVCEQILKHRSREELLEPSGVLVCGSGVGMSIAANRHPGIRAVLAWSPDVAVLSRQHNASNVLCLGARLLPFETIEDILEAWIASPFEGGRHQTRIDLIEPAPGGTKP